MGQEHVRLPLEIEFGVIGGRFGRSDVGNRGLMFRMAHQHRMGKRLGLALLIDVYIDFPTAPHVFEWKYIVKTSLLHSIKGREDELLMATPQDGIRTSVCFMEMIFQKARNW